MQEQFKQWLLNQGKTQNTANSYAAGVNAVAKHYSHKTDEQIDIYQVNDIALVSKIARQYGRGGDYSQDGDRNSGGWRAAIARYAEFVADLQKEDAAFAENGARVLDVLAEEHRQNLKYESDLQNVFCAQISELFPGYKILGREYPINGKRIDVLLECGESGDLLIVELKAGRTDCAVFGQISMYMGMLQKKFAGRKIRGVIVAGAADNGLLYACDTNADISVKFYRMNLELEDSDVPDTADSDTGD